MTIDSSAKGGQDMRKFRFRQFNVYNNARIFREKIRELSKKLPKEEQFSLTQQLWRALDSIVLNTAEGADRGTDKDFAHFLNNSHTSLNEVVACLDLALDSGYITETEQQLAIKEAENLANELTAFRKSLISKPTK